MYTRITYSSTLFYLDNDILIKLFYVKLTLTSQGNTFRFSFFV